MRVSVCVATFNGGLYVEEQLNSILAQLSLDDEVIVCDDQSSDDTLEKIAAINDRRIKIYVNTTNLGYVRNFERAVSLAEGDYLFLSDQDDVWPAGRLFKMLEAFEASRKSVVVGNFDVFTTGETGFRKYHACLTGKYNRTGILNIIQMMKGGIPYFGCCMGFRKEFVKYYLPFPDPSVSHDIWLAIVSNFRGEIFHISDIVSHRRLHDTNITIASRSLVKKIGTRLRWLRLLLRCHLA